MAEEAVQFQFGKYQYFTSDKMSKNPALGKLVQNIFGYTQLAVYSRWIIFKKLLSYVPTKNLKHILDLGCGQGEFSIAMAEAFPQATVDGIDLDTASINRIDKTIKHFNINNVHTYNCKIEELPHNDHYDLIFSIDVFEHILDEEKPFDECYKKLKKGGYLIIKFPHKTQKTIMPSSWFETHDKWLEDEHVGQNDDLPDLIKRFEKANFKVVKAFYSDGDLARFSWEWNYLMFRASGVLHLLSLPFCKLLMRIDLANIDRKRGNYIQVVGMKA